MAGFTGAVVAGQFDGGKQLFDAMAVMDLPGASADELGSVVGLADQGCTALAVETVEDVAHPICLGTLQWLTGDHVAGGEIADVEDVAESTLDGCVGLPDIGGPDRSRRGPHAGSGMAVAQLVTQLQPAAVGD